MGVCILVLVLNEDCGSAGLEWGRDPGFLPLGLPDQEIQLAGGEKVVDPSPWVSLMFLGDHNLREARPFGARFFPPL